MTRKRVLVVEDQRDQIMRFRHELKAAEVTVATSVTEAQKLVAEADFDLIIMDDYIKDNDHYTFAFTKQLREQGFANPIIAAGLNHHHLERQMKMGCSHRSGKLKAAKDALELLGLDAA